MITVKRKRRKINISREEDERRIETQVEARIRDEVMKIRLEYEEKFDTLHSYYKEQLARETSKADRLMDQLSNLYYRTSKPDAESYTDAIRSGYHILDATVNEDAHYNINKWKADNLAKERLYSDDD